MRKIKRYINDMDKILLISVIALCIFGLLNIVTASSREAVTNLDESLFYYFYRHSIFLILGIIGTIIILSVPTKKYYNYIPLLYVTMLGMNLWLVFKGSSTRGANNWIDLDFFKLQPSELTKPILIIMLACLFEKFYKHLKNKTDLSVKKIMTILIIGAISVLIVFLQKDLGTAAIICGIFGIMLLTSPINKKFKFQAITVLIIGVLLVAIVFLSNGSKILTDAQSSRLDYFNPCSKYEKSGYQVCNAFIAINSGGLFGVGIGKSAQKYSYIPEPHTDMVFSIISEEYGLLKSTLIFIVYIIILYRILNLASKTQSVKGRYICIGVATYIFLHIFINLGGLFGVIPLTGVPLPFLSYGGSFTLSLLAALAVVQRVHIENKNLKIKI